MTIGILNNTRKWPALLGLALLGACTSTTVDEFRQGETGIESHEGLTHYGLYDTVVARE